MVIRGGTRGNGAQLARYLLLKSENEAIRILEVDGLLHADKKTLTKTLVSMDLTSEFTKSEKGLYHAQINPAIGEDKSMTDEKWQLAADMLAKELGYENQRRVIVLHTKKGRTHAHVAWERYDKGKGIMIKNDFSRLAQDRARQEMEKVLEHKPTPFRNKHRPELKASILQLWHQTGTGAQFIKAAREHNYIIAGGTNRPFMVVDQYARSFDLVRQLQGVRTKEVRERLRGEKLMGEKEAISYMRKEMSKKIAELEKQLKEHASSEQHKFDKAKQQFEVNKDKATKNNKEEDPRRAAIRKEIEEMRKALERDKDKDKDIGPEPG